MAVGRRVADRMAAGRRVAGRMAVGRRGTGRMAAGRRVAGRMAEVSGERRRMSRKISRKLIRLSGITRSRRLKNHRPPYRYKL